MTSDEIVALLVPRSSTDERPFVAGRTWTRRTEVRLRAGAMDDLKHVKRQDEDGTTGQPELDVTRLLDALEASTCGVDALGNIVMWNRAWSAFALENGGQVTQARLNYLEVCATSDGSATSGLDRLDARAAAAGLRQILEGTTDRFEYEYPCHGPKEQRWFSVRMTPWRFAGAPGAAITHVDVTAMHQAQAALNHQVLHDELTGLPNRTLLRDRLRQALFDGTRRDLLVAVGFVDLDLFKRINSSLGHTAGDALLMQIGWRLSRQLRSGDTLARFGGDEFVAVWRDVESEEQALLLAERLAEGLTGPFELEGAAVSVSASIGLVTSRTHQNAEQLLQSADAAMYAAKRQGRDRVLLFGQEVRHVEHERLTTDGELRSALAHGELVLQYQPVIELRTGRPVGLEALVRWNHPTRGQLPPSQFIALAESSGLITELGQWSLAQACRDAASLVGEAASLHIAVNLSTRQLNDHNVVAHVRQALADSGLNPGRLVLEVTESAIMEDEDTAALVLDELHDLGVQLAIDDFGTGFSSLLYLRRYPINAIKIDRAFVAPLPDSRDDQAICRSVVSLATAVRAVSVAEGVETAEQYATLRAMGCQLAQGFLWSPAVGLTNLGAALASCRAVPRPTARPAARTRPQAQVDPAVRLRIEGLQHSGASLHTIAAALNAEGTKSLGGLRWTATAVARQLCA